MATQHRKNEKRPPQAAPVACGHYGRAMGWQTEHVACRFSSGGDSCPSSANHSAPGERESGRPVGWCFLQECFLLGSFYKGFGFPNGVVRFSEPVSSALPHHHYRESHSAPGARKRPVDDCPLRFSFLSLKGVRISAGQSGGNPPVRVEDFRTSPVRISAPSPGVRRAVATGFKLNVTSDQASEHGATYKSRRH